MFPLPTHGLGDLQMPKRTRTQFGDVAVAGRVQGDYSLGAIRVECKRDAHPVLPAMAPGTGKPLPHLLLGHRVLPRAPAQHSQAWKQTALMNLILTPNIGPYGGR